MSNLQSIENVRDAKLPGTYEQAKYALQKCYKIDECKDWADKAQALASYAKQADDKTLEKLANRIRSRAIRRAGELLKQFDGKGNNQHNKGNHVTQKEAAKRAGFSQHQKEQAVRVANVEEEEFEELIDSDNPPTLSKLAEKGKQSRNPHLQKVIKYLETEYRELSDQEKDRITDWAKRQDKPPTPEILDNVWALICDKPEGFKEATELLGTVKRFYQYCKKSDLKKAINGLDEDEKQIIKEMIPIIDQWLDKIMVRL